MENLPITLRIGSQNYRYNIPRDMEEAYRKAESLINEKAGQYMQHYPNQSDEQYLVLTLLDIALKNVQERMANDAKVALDAMEKLNKELDEIL